MIIFNFVEIYVRYEMDTITALKEKEYLRNNSIVTEEINNIQFSNSKIIFKGENNYVFLDKDAQLKNTTVTFHGDNSVLYIGKTKNDKIEMKVTLYNNSLIFLNEGCSFNKPLTAIASEAKDIIVGKDVMFSSGCWIRNSDVHMMYDENQRRINESKNVIIGDHVWIGQDSSILKGSYIGSGSIIGLGSIVAKKIKTNSTNAGNPVKKIKDNIFWDRQSSHFFTEEDTQKNKFYMKDSSFYVFNNPENLTKWQDTIQQRPTFTNHFEIESFLKKVMNLEPLVVLV
ncbi:acyltransferase [Tetragenococcus koreensis]|nr:acyltransferase [Tetragenococcus koreensis]